MKPILIVILAILFITSVWVVIASPHLLNKNKIPMVLETKQETIDRLTKQILIKTKLISWEAGVRVLNTPHTITGSLLSD